MVERSNIATYIKNYLYFCNTLGVRFDRVLLFGSYARNQQHQESDIDLALVSPQFTGKPLDVRLKIAIANIRFFDIEPHLYTPDEFKNGDAFIEEIKRTGVDIQVTEN